MKYKIAAGFSALIGLFQIIMAISQLFIKSKLNSVYQEFGGNAAPDTVIIGVVALVVGVLNTFLAWRLVSSKENQKQKLFLPVIITALVSILVTTIVTIVMQILMISPINNLML